MEFVNDAKKNLRLQPKSVLFVTSQLRQREIKMASALKSQGWLLGLIYYNSTPFKPEGYFDYIYEVKSAEEAHEHASQLAPRLVHVFSGAIDDYVMLFCRDKIAPVVIDLNDVFTPALMDYCPERYAPTREALALADGFCGRDLQVKAAEKIDHCQLPPHLLLYPEYCWNNTPRANNAEDDEIHIVSVGTISLETYGMYDCCYLELATQITAQNIHLHLYPPWCYRKDHAEVANVSFERDYAQFLELERMTSYLHIHDSLPVEELAKELPQYDFGIISGGCEAFGQRYSHFKPTYVEKCYSGRIADYLDAHLPVLINDEVAFDYKLLKRYGVCVDLKGIMQPNFKSRLQTLKRDAAMKKKVDQSIESLSIMANAERLADFYTKVMRSSAYAYKKRKISALILKKLKRIVPQKIKIMKNFLMD